jgi:ribosomal protein L32
MAVPKRKISKSRKKKRLGSFSKKFPAFNIDSDGNYSLFHRVNKKGIYRRKKKL